MAAVAQQSAELVQQVGAEAARTVQVAGRAVSIITLMLCAAAIWFIARAVLNRLVHALKGNSLPAAFVELVGGEATFAVRGRRSQVMHRVWVRLDSKQSACGCKAFLQEGACGHCDAAVQMAVQMGLVHPDVATSASEGARPAELGSRVIALCEISCLSGLLNRGGLSPSPPERPQRRQLRWPSQPLWLRQQRRAPGATRRRGLSHPAAPSMRWRTWLAALTSQPAYLSWRRPDRGTECSSERTRSTRRPSWRRSRRRAHEERHAAWSPTLRNAPRPSFSGNR